MTTSPLQEERRVSDAIVDVLAEAGVEFVLGMPGGYTGPIFSSLHGHPTIRTVQVREESIGASMAEAYGRLTGRPLVVMGQGEWIAGNAGQGFLEALLGSSPIVILTEMTDGGALSHHAPYQSGTGDYGTWDARGALRRRDQAGHGQPRPGPGRAAHPAGAQARAHRRARPGRRHLPQHGAAGPGRAGVGAADLPDRGVPAPAVRRRRRRRARRGRRRPRRRRPTGHHRRQRRPRRPGLRRPGRAGPGPRRARRDDGERQGRLRRDRSPGRRRDGQLRLAERQRGPRRRRRRARRRHQARPARHRRRARRPPRPEPPDAHPDRHRTAQRGVDLPRRPRPRRRRRRRPGPAAGRDRRAGPDRRQRRARPGSPRRWPATTSSAPPSSAPTRCRWPRSGSSASSTRRSPTTPSSPATPARTGSS